MIMKKSLMFYVTFLEKGKKIVEHDMKKSGKEFCRLREED